MLATLLPAQRLLDRTQTLDFIAPLQGLLAFRSPACRRPFGLRL
ncbi:hypothetical protein UMZ34_01055 [Halopseudomonas pachastrellae]|nr:hypothetical protein UMZ34_01055 [Halopseudomonas pachastrellae]